MSAHAHSHAGPPPELAPAQRRRVTLILVLLIAPLVGLVGAGLVLLWPHDVASALPTGARYAAGGVQTVHATVTDVVPFACGNSDPDVAATAGSQGVCANVTATVTGKHHSGERATFVVQPPVVRVGVYPGDKVQLLRVPNPTGATASYSWGDFSRGRPLVLLGLVFAGLVIGVARLRGALALVGLGVTFWLLVAFLLPALLQGHSPLLVAAVGTSAILIVVLYLAHGVTIRTTTALIGTLAGLAASAGLGSWAVGAAHLTGIANEDDLTVQAFAPHINFTGLLLCGVIIAGLGVLNDVTVTQASAVWELHAADPTASPPRLFAAAMRIGRDHIASSVYTIAFAYAGSALPLLLLIQLAQRPVTQTLTSEALAQEIVSTLVGAIALVLAVPLTTAVGVVLVNTAGHRRTDRPARRRRGHRVPDHVFRSEPDY